MEPHVFAIDGMTFVSGLFWYPLSGINNSDRMQEIRSLAREQNFDLYISRQSTSYYVGFAHSSGIIKNGVFSAAAVVSKTLELESSTREFIFVDCLPDGNWIYVAQRDGVILPDGDKSFPSEDAAKSRLLEDISLGDWAMIIAPDIWGVTGSIERDFESFLPDSGTGKRRAHKWWKLSSVNPYQNVQLMAKLMVIAVFFLLVGGAVWWNLNKDHALSKIQNLGQTPPPLPPPEHPWKNMPDAEDFVGSCLGQIEKTTLFPGNWEISSVKCQPTMLEISWSAKDYGWIDHIKAVIPNVNISSGGKLAYLAIPLSPLTIGKDESVSLGSERMLEMYAKAQRYGFAINVTVAPPPPQPLPGDPAQQAPVQDWGELVWQVKGTEHPEMVAEVLNKNGFRLRSMDAVWNNGRFVWNMEGTQYVLP